MGALNIPWEIANTARDPVLESQKGALAGLEIGQKRAGINALRGIDLADPQSIQRAVNASASAGLLDQATGTLKLGATRSALQSLPQILDRLGKLGETSSTAAPAATPSAIPAATQPPDFATLPPDQQIHALQTFSQIDAIEKQVSQLPYDQRKAAIADLAKPLIERGLPADLVNNFDPTDENIAKMLADHDAARNAILSPQQAATAPAAPTTAPAQPAAIGQPPAAPAGPGGAPAWPGQILSDPALVQGLNTVKSLTGIDTGLPDMAERLAMPQIQAQAAIGQAGPVAEAQHAVEARYAGPIAQAKALAELGPKIAQSMVEAQIQAGNTTLTVPEFGADGQPTGRSTTTTLANFKAPKASGGMGGSVTGLSPAEQEGQKTDVAQYRAAFQAATDPTAYADAQRKVASAEQAIKLATALKPDAFTGKAEQAANIMSAVPGFGSLTGRAGDMATYHSLLQNIMRGSFTNFPKIEKEFELVSAASAKITTPMDAAKFTLGIAAAMARKDLAYRGFVRDHPEITTNSALNRAWLASPQGRAEPFADPVFKDMTIGGKPAVSAPVTDPQGRMWAVWRPGTPQKQIFRVR